MSSAISVFSSLKKSLRLAQERQPANKRPAPTIVEVGGELTTGAVRIHLGPPYTWSTAFLAYPNERISFSLHRAGSRIGYRITIVHTIPPSIFTVSIAALA